MTTFLEKCVDLKKALLATLVKRLNFLMDGNTSDLMEKDSFSVEIAALMKQQMQLQTDEAMDDQQFRKVIISVLPRLECPLD